MKTTHAPPAKITRRRQAHLLSICRPAVAAILIIVCLVSIYRPGFNSAWLYDDYPNIVNNPNVHLTELTAGNLLKILNGRHLDQRLDSRPLSYFTFAINYYLHRTRVFGYHIADFVIHCLTAAALFSFAVVVFGCRAAPPYLRRRRFYLALLAAAMWATHPVQVTAVTYVVQRMAQLACLFSLVSMVAYLKARLADARMQKIFFLFTATLSAVAAMASKENAALLPLNLVLCEMLIIQRPAAQKKRAYALLWLLVLLPTVIYALLAGDLGAILSGYQHRPFSLVERLLTQPRVLLLYLSQIAYPVGSQFTFLHDITISRGLASPWTTLPAIIVLVGSAGYAISRAGKHRLIAFAWLFFLLNHALEGSIIPLELIYEHRNYLPSSMLFIGIVGVLAGIYEKTTRRRSLHAVFLLSMGLFLAMQSHTAYTRAKLFADPLRLWLDNLEKSPRLSIVHNNLGTELWNQGRTELAGHFFRSAKKLNRFMNTHQSGHVDYNLGLYAAYIEKNHELALESFQAAYQVNRGYPEIWAELARCHYLAGRPGEAARLLARAAQTWPHSRHLLYTTAFIALKEDDPHRAIPIIEHLLEDTPADAKLLSLAAAVFLKVGKLEESRQVLNQWKVLEPSALRPRLGLVEVYYFMEQPAAVSAALDELNEHAAAETVTQLLKRLEHSQREHAYVPDPAVILPLLSRRSAPHPDSTGQPDDGFSEQ